MSGAGKMKGTRTKGRAKVVSDGGESGMRLARQVWGHKLWKRYGKYSKVRDGLMARFGISESTAERDIADLHVRMREDFERYKQVAAQDILEDLLGTRIASATDGEHSARVSANRALMKLAGLEPEHMEHSGHVTIDVEAQVQAMVAKMRPDFTKLTREERETMRALLKKMAPNATAEDGVEDAAPAPSKGATT